VPAIGAVRPASSTLPATSSSQERTEAATTSISSSQVFRKILEQLLPTVLTENPYNTLVHGKARKVLKGATWYVKTKCLLILF
jgi:hypothetical protein